MRKNDERSCTATALEAGDRLGVEGLVEVTATYRRGLIGETWKPTLWKRCDHKEDFASRK